VAGTLSELLGAVGEQGVGEFVRDRVSDSSSRAIRVEFDPRPFRAYRNCLGIRNVCACHDVNLEQIG
jgi:hypothetical protein